MMLETIHTPADLKNLSYEQLDELCAEIRKLERKLRMTTVPVRKAEINAEIENLYWELEG